jgi:hypothetical protein
MASLIFGNLFGRFPGLRVLSIENGSRWVPKLLADMDHVMHYTQPTTLWPGGALSDLPSETFKQHDDLEALSDAERHTILRDNGLALLGLAGA